MKSSLENEIEAATLKRLLSHLDERKDVQNIDLMNLAGFSVETAFQDGIGKKVLN